MVKTETRNLLMLNFETHLLLSTFMYEMEQKSKQFQKNVCPDCTGVKTG